MPALKGNQHERNAPHVVKVAEDEGLLQVESEGQNVANVLAQVLACLIERHVLEQELFVIGHLNHERHIERLLQIPAHAGI
jgi:hypothetical protein